MIVNSLDVDGDESVGRNVDELRGQPPWAASLLHRDTMSHSGLS